MANYLIVCALCLCMGLIGKISASKVTTQYSGLLNDLLEINTQERHIKITKFCQSELDFVSQAIQGNEFWPIKLLDASGFVDSGFIWGNNYWLGSERACNFVNSPVRVLLGENPPKNHIPNLTTIASPISVGYRIVWAKHYSKWQLDIKTHDKAILHIGLCVPQSCSNNDLHKLTDALLKSDNFNRKYIVHGDFSVIQAKSLVLRDEFLSNPMVYSFLCILLINLFLVCLGTFYTQSKNSSNSKSEEELKKPIADSKGNCSDNSSETYSERSKRPTVLARFFSSLCMVKNSNIITSSDLGSDSIEPIHGMRALGMIWIVASHLFFYAPGSIKNLQMILTYAENWYLRPLFATALCVDTYFVISGLVLAYLFFQTNKKPNQQGAVVNFASSVISRYLRLTPPYLVVLALTGCVSIYLRDTSAYWMVEANDENCSKYWWRNVLYIQNLYPMEEMCMSWSWYLAVDFQCFVLTTFLLAVWTKLPRLAWTLFGSIFLACITYVSHLSYSMSYSLSLDVQYNTIDYLYTPAYTRIAPYFIGAYIGYFLSRYERKLNIKKIYVIMGWTLLPLLNLILIFEYTTKELTPVDAILFGAFGKTAWAIGTAWMILACATGHGGVMNRILSAKILLPFSRMTYTAYLINPICIIYVSMSMGEAVLMDYFSLVIYGAGFQVIVFTLSYIFMIIFENPFIRVGKLLQGK